MKSKERVQDQLDKQKMLINSTLTGLNISALKAEEVVKRLNQILTLNQSITEYVNVEKLS